MFVSQIFVRISSKFQLLPIQLYGGVFQVYLCTARPPGQRATGDLGNYRMFNEVKTIIVATQHCTLL